MLPSWLGAPVSDPASGFLRVSVFERGGPPPLFGLRLLLRCQRTSICFLALRLRVNRLVRQSGNAATAENPKCLDSSAPPHQRSNSLTFQPGIKFLIAPASFSYCGSEL